MVYDVIIIGAGMAGLYAAHQIQKMHPNIKLLILEENQIGGRAGTEPFQGVPVAIGAGVGRKEKDTLLLKLVQEFNLPSHEFQASTNYAPTIPGGKCNVKQVFSELRKQYISKKPEQTTFREFAEPILGKDAYAHFTTCAGYTDYENEDVKDTLYHYGFDDNFKEWTGFSVPWTELVQALASKIRINGGHIQTLCKVTAINKPTTMTDPEFIVKTAKNATQYQAKKIILATTIKSVLHLVPGALSKTSLYKQICGQPFLRIYGRFTKACIPILQEHVQKTTIVPGPLHKLIPMNPEKGIYMIAYTDNDGAKILAKYGENNPKNRETLCCILEKALGLEKGVLHLRAIIDFYWHVGTHYYAPLEPNDNISTRQEFIHVAQRPMPNMWIVGEMISMKQGWTEGALESVEAILSKKRNKKNTYI